MTLQTERLATRQAAEIGTNSPAALTARAPRGGSYVTAPGNRPGAPHTEGTDLRLAARRAFRQR